MEGDRVALHLPNSVDFVVAALACLWIGAIFVPLAVTDPAARLDVILGDCAPAVVVTSDEEGDGDATPARTAGHRWVPISALRAPRAEPPGTATGSTDRVAYAIYTSGTTGTPKGVLIGNRAFAAAVAATADALGLSADTRTLCVSPFHFDGSFGTLFPTLFSGGAVVIRPREALLFPRTFFNAVSPRGHHLHRLLAQLPAAAAVQPPDGPTGRDHARVVALGGEACSAADVRVPVGRRRPTSRCSTGTVPPRPPSPSPTSGVTPGVDRRRDGVHRATPPGRDLPPGRRAKAVSSTRPTRSGSCTSAGPS